MCGRLVLGAVTVLAVLMSSLWLDHLRETTLPPPTGRFAVSRASFVWKDEAHTDVLAPPVGTKRELTAWIWYPTVAKRSATNAAQYMPASWREALEQHSSVLFSRFLTRDLSRVRSYSVSDGELPSQPRTFPIVLMRPGAAALTLQYCVLAEDLASHGYVVVGFDAPYRSYVTVFPDGRVIPRAPQNDVELVRGSRKYALAERLLAAWTADVEFALDRLERLNASDASRFHSRLDMQKIGMVGHSLGGATAAQFCHDDARCRAGIDIDGLLLGSVVKEGLDRPFMFLLSDQTHETDSETANVMAEFKSVAARLPNAKSLLMVRGANHFSFSDDGALLKIPMLRSVLRFVGIIGIDGQRQLAITSGLVHSFFDVYLKGESGDAALSLSALPEVARLN